MTSPLPERDPESISVASVTDGAGGIRLFLTGDLDFQGVLDIENDVRWAVANAHGEVILDCADISFIDSSGLRLVVQAQMMAADHHLAFSLDRPPPEVQRILTMAGLDDIVVTSPVPEA